MKAKIIFGLLIISLSILNAQNTKSTVKTHKFLKPYIDSIWHKNEIGFGISAPLLSSTTYKGLKNIDLSIQYKRLFTRRNALRIGLNYNENGSKSYTTESYLPSVNIVNNDSVMVGRTFYNHYYTGYLNLGYEHYFGKKRVKFLLGADLTFGFRDHEYFNDYYYASYQVDTIGNEIVSNFDIRTNLDNQNILYLNKNQHDYSLRFGLKTFVGARIPITNRLIFNFITSYHIGLDRLINSNATYKNNIFIDVSGVVSEVSLFYRF